MIPETPGSREAFLQEAFTELAAQPTLLLPVQPLEAWIVTSQLQLALRHPRNTGPAALVAEGVARRLQEYVAPPGTLRAEIAARGWERIPDPGAALVALADRARLAAGALKTLGQQDEARGAYYEELARELAAAIAAVDPGAYPGPRPPEATP